LGFFVVFLSFRTELRKYHAYPVDTG
jgi:hypothetical protein